MATHSQPGTIAERRRPERQPERQRSFSARRVIKVVLTWMSVWWLLLGLLINPVLPGGWLALLAAALLSAAPLAGLARWFGRGIAPTALARLLIIRPFWYTQLLLPLLAIAGLLGAIFGLPFGAPGQVGRVFIAIMGALMLAVGLAGYVGSRWLMLRRLDVLLPQLPAELEGLRVVQLSDLHVGPHTSRRHLRRVAQLVREAQPELIVYTGDQVDDYAADVEHFAAAFGALTAPLGSFAIAGNHDVYAGWRGVRQGLERMGLRVLVNQAAPLERNGTRFWLAGTGDPAGGYAARPGEEPVAPDIPRTLAEIPAGEFTLALAHNPALWPELARAGVPLTLSGHTHYGQLAIPRLGWSLVSLFTEHAMGSYRQDDALLYINPGTNYWGIPFRIGALPEVTLLTLRRGAEGACAVQPADNLAAGGRP